jgi:hypothetical protein
MSVARQPHAPDLVTRRIRNVGTIRAVRTLGVERTPVPARHCEVSPVLIHGPLGVDGGGVGGSPGGPRSEGLLVLDGIAILVQDLHEYGMHAARFTPSSGRRKNLAVAFEPRGNQFPISCSRSNIGGDDENAQGVESGIPFHVSGRRRLLIHGDGKSARIGTAASVVDAQRDRKRTGCVISV